MVLGFRRSPNVGLNQVWLRARCMITGADSTLGVEPSQETFAEMCEGIVKKFRAIYKETVPADSSVLTG